MEFINTIKGYNMFFESEQNDELNDIILNVGTRSGLDKDGYTFNGKLRKPKLVFNTIESEFGPLDVTYSAYKDSVYMDAVTGESITEKVVVVQLKSDITLEKLIDLLNSLCVELDQQAIAYKFNGEGGLVFHRKLRDDAGNITDNVPYEFSDEYFFNE